MRKPVSRQMAAPRAGEGKRGEDGYLAYLLRQAAGAVRMRIERALEQLEVTAAQFAVLTMLDAYPGLSGADLARLALLTPQTVHGITANLLRAGLIAHTPNPVHGRAKRLGLTPAGASLLAWCRERVQPVDRSLADGLSPVEEAAVRRWLTGLAVAGGDRSENRAAGLGGAADGDNSGELKQRYVSHGRHRRAAKAGR